MSGGDGEHWSKKTFVKLFRSQNFCLYHHFIMYYQSNDMKGFCNSRCVGVSEQKLVTFES